MDTVPFSLSRFSFCKNLNQVFQCVYWHGTMLFNMWARVQCVLAGKVSDVPVEVQALRKQVAAGLNDSLGGGHLCVGIACLRAGLSLGSRGQAFAAP